MWKCVDKNEKSCYVGSKSILSVHSTMKDDAILVDQSMLLSQHTIPQNQCWQGSPARPEGSDGVFKQNILALPKAPLVSVWKRFGLFFYLGYLFVLAIYYGALTPGILLIDHFYFKKELLLTIFLATPLAVCSFFLLFCALTIGTKQLLIGKLI